MLSRRTSVPTAEATHPRLQNGQKQLTQTKPQHSQGFSVKVFSLGFSKSSSGVKGLGLRDSGVQKGSNYRGSNNRIPIIHLRKVAVLEMSSLIEGTRILGWSEDGFEL